MTLSLLLTAYFWLFLALMLGVVVMATVETAVFRSGRRTDFTLVRESLPSLLRRGYQDAYLRVSHEATARHLFFRKYVRGEGDCGLEICGRGTEWSEAAWHRAQDLAESRGFSHRIDPPKTGDGGRSVVVIDCGQDVTTAYEIAQGIWTGIFGLSLETPFKVGMDGCSTFDELIDGPDHPPPLDEFDSIERLKEFDARSRKLGLPTSTHSCFAGIAILVLVVSGIGFPISMLLSRGATPDWSLAFGSLGFGGSTASVVFLLILVLSFWAMRRLSFTKPKPRRNPWDKGLLWLGRAVVAVLPIAVFLAWAGL